MEGEEEGRGKRRLRQGKEEGRVRGGEERDWRRGGVRRREGQEGRRGNEGEALKRLYSVFISIKNHHSKVSVSVMQHCWRHKCV